MQLPSPDKRNTRLNELFLKKEVNLSDKYHVTTGESLYEKSSITSNPGSQCGSFLVESALKSRIQG